MASVGATSRKPSGSPAHSPGQSRSQSPLSTGHVPRIFGQTSAVEDPSALRSIRSSREDTSPGTSKAQSAAAKLAPLALSRYDVPSSTSPSGRKGYTSSASPYSTQFASLLPNTPGTFDARSVGPGTPLDVDPAGGIKSTHAHIASPGFPSMEQHHPQRQTTAIFPLPTYNNPPQYSAAYTRADMSTYYPPTSSQAFTSYPNYQYQPPLTPSLYASPPPPTPRSMFYVGLVNPQLPSTSQDVIRSPTGAFYPNFTGTTAQSSYFYQPGTPTHPYHQIPSSPHISHPAPINASPNVLPKPNTRISSWGGQQLRYPSNQRSNVLTRNFSAAPHSPRYFSAGNPPSLTVGGTPRSLNSSASFRHVPPVRVGRRKAFDTASSGTDSGVVVVRSAILEEFRTGKARKWELKEIVGHIVEFSSDQYGSRFIQTKVENCEPGELEIIAREILPNHALPLMSDVFGNYVIQRIFENGTDADRQMLISQMRGSILALSLQMYGCRVVQKALDYLSPDQQTWFVDELEPEALACVKDSNANHVIQKLLQTVAPERLTLIRAFVGHLPELATHPYGCRVLQRCFNCLPSSHTQVLADELNTHALVLMQDQFGNYVVQYVLEHTDKQNRAAVIDTLSGHLLPMSRHKFASNVCEKALIFGDSAGRRKVIAEILGPNGDSATVVAMMKDQFANYVLQQALRYAEGEQFTALVNKIRPQIATLRRFSNIYHKHLAAIEKLIAERGSTAAATPKRANVRHVSG